jgi:hypothetical protein
MIQINLAESNGMSKWSQYRLFIVGPSELDNKADLDVEFNLLDRFRQFIFAADCSTEIKSLFHSIAVFRLIYRELNADISAGKDVAAGISLAQMTLDQLTRRLSLCGMELFVCV